MATEDPTDASTDSGLSSFKMTAQTAQDPETRAMALRQLRAVAGHSVAEGLVHALADPDADVRITALEELALGRLE